MTFDDVTGHSLGARKKHYRKQWGAYEAKREERVIVCKLADQQARDEMLEEIHVMLRMLFNIPDEDD